MTAEEIVFLSKKIYFSNFFSCVEILPKTGSVWQLHAFFVSNTFISNARLKLAKNQANIKQHPKVELWLFENYSHSSSTLSSKNNSTYSKKYSKENENENEKYST